MIELKVKDPQALMNVVEVLKANGHEVRTYVQWDDKVGSEVSYFTVEVPDITIGVPDKPGTRSSRELERIRRYIRPKEEWE